MGIETSQSFTVYQEDSSFTVVGNHWTSWSTGIVLSSGFSYQRAWNEIDFQPFKRSPRPPDNQEVTGTVLNYLSSQPFIQWSVKFDCMIMS